MYIEHFGLAQYPFSLTPNTRYFLKLPTHQRAFDFIVEALAGEESFIKITGEVGTGKTMLCRKVLNALEVHPDRYLTAFIPNPVLNDQGIMSAIAEESGLDFDPSSTYSQLLRIVTEKIISLARDGKSMIILIDEAQAMAEESLEAIRLLTQVEPRGDSQAALYVVLFGQPELDDILQRPALRELNRALCVSTQLDALNRAAVEAYLSHRLGKAGYNGSNLFNETAMDLLFKHSKGIPRLINILAHKAMMAAFGKGDSTISDSHVQLAIEDTESAQHERLKSNRLFSS